MTTYMGGVITARNTLRDWIHYGDTITGTRSAQARRGLSRHLRNGDGILPMLAAWGELIHGGVFDDDIDTDNFYFGVHSNNTNGGVPFTVPAFDGYAEREFYLFVTPSDYDDFGEPAAPADTFGYFGAGMWGHMIGLSQAEEQAASAMLSGNPGQLPDGLVLSGDGSALTEVTLSPELLANLPERARPFATRVVPATSAQDLGYWAFEEGVARPTVVIGSNSPLMQSVSLVWGINSAEDLSRAARADYVSWLRSTRSVRMSEANAEFERARQEHRRKSEANFSAFRKKRTTDEVLITTLPFVPHGLASSRRWGIEIESGGARGVKAPKGWERKRDGSLRSAWEGFKEVQDFEPYDEEVTETIAWTACENRDRHFGAREVWDAASSNWITQTVEDYISPDECTMCGEVTRTVHRTPQTITHRRQDDDCAEFVSPILTSMHSDGVKKLTKALIKQPQNDTAGVHVHVEANDLTDEQIATLIYGYDLLEGLLEPSYKRGKDRQYCKRREGNNVLSIARSLKSKDAQNVRGGDRYVTVNTQSLGRHGTIEFRAMGAVYDYDHLIRWAMFCREMVNVVTAGATHKDFGRVKKWEDVLALFARFGKEYLRAAIYELSGETGEAAKLVKDKAPVTREALDADLRAHIARFIKDAQAEAVESRLVGVYTGTQI